MLRLLLGTAPPLLASDPWDLQPSRQDPCKLAPQVPCKGGHLAGEAARPDTLLGLLLQLSSEEGRRSLEDSEALHLARPAPSRQVRHLLLSLHAIFIHRHALAH